MKPIFTSNTLYHFIVNLKSKHPYSFLINSLSMLHIFFHFSLSISYLKLSLYHYHLRLSNMKFIIIYYILHYLIIRVWVRTVTSTIFPFKVMVVFIVFIDITLCLNKVNKCKCRLEK